MEVPESSNFRLQIGRDLQADLAAPAALLILEEDDTVLANIQRHPLLIDVTRVGGYGGVIAQTPNNDRSLARVARSNLAVVTNFVAVSRLAFLLLLSVFKSWSAHLLI